MFSFARGPNPKILLSARIEQLERENLAVQAVRDRDETIIRSIGEGIIVVDGSRNIILINPAAEELLAVSPEEAIGKKPGEILDLLHQDKIIPTDQRPIWKTLHFGEAIKITLRDNIFLQTRSGKKFPVAMTTAPLRQGKSPGAVIIFRDLTEERRAREIIQQQITVNSEELQERRAQLLASIKNLDLGFIMTDEKLSIIMINEAAVKLFSGQLPDTLSTTPSRIAVGLKLADLDTIIGEGVKLQDECRRTLASQKTRTLKNIPFGNLYLHFYLSPIIVNARPIGCSILAEDVTEGRLLERSKDEFFSIASHELRTPLSAIRGNTAMIEKFLVKISPKELKGMIGDIHESSIRLIEMVSDFLDLSRLQLGKIKFDRQVLDLKPLIQSVIKELQMSAGQKDLYLKYLQAKPLPRIVADQNRVKQILVNLIGNSINFTDHGGITVKSELENEFIKISVTDTGRGMSKESQRLLFRKFQQTGENLLTRDTTRGTGLGLYISKLLTRAMGGTIGLVTSAPNQGSAFAFTLPIAKKKPVTSEGKRPELTDSGQPSRLTDKKR